MQYFPLYADLNGRLCLLIGKGKMIEEKSKILQQAGASIRKRSDFSETDAEDVFLIVADVEEENAKKIHAYGERNQIFVNIVDKPKYCSFIIPAIAQQQDLLIAISTSGKSPALAGWIRQRLQEEYGPHFRDLLDALGDTREGVKRILPKYGDRKDFYLGLLNGGFIDTAKRGRKATRLELEERLHEFRKTLQRRKRS